MSGTDLVDVLQQTRTEVCVAEVLLTKYDLSDEDPARLDAQEPSRLVEIIIDGVRKPRTVHP